MHNNPIALVLLTIAGAAHGQAAEQAQPPAEPSPVRPSAPTKALVQRLKLSPFYRQHLSAGGLPILGSAAVDPHALMEARYLIDKMLVGRDDIRQRLVANKVRFSIMAIAEMTTAIPEHATLQPAKYWDRRARGLGASRSRPSVSCGEENLLRLPGDPYHQENILIHEFAHAIHLMALVELDRSFDPRLQKAYRSAIKQGLWRGKYAGTNKNEYWAEGVQSWFDTNRKPDHDHNHVDTREELIAYDPGLAGLIKEVFGEGTWRYRNPSLRSATQRRHLAGYRPGPERRFRWPKGLETWYRNYMKKQTQRR